MLKIDGKSEAYSFYVDRISAAPLYGFKAGYDILKTVSRCAFHDSDLSYEEFKLIQDRIEACHRKLLEVNYNEGWD